MTSLTRYQIEQLVFNYLYDLIIYPVVFKPSNALSAKLGPGSIGPKKAAQSKAHSVYGKILTQFNYRQKRPVD